MAWRVRFESTNPAQPASGTNFIVAESHALGDAVFELVDVFHRFAGAKRLQRLAGVGSWQQDLTTGALTWSAESFRQVGFEPDAVAFECYWNRMDHVMPV